MFLFVVIKGSPRVNFNYKTMITFLKKKTIFIYNYYKEKFIIVDLIMINAE
ncbi:hypothetical protein CHCC20441_1283 [Bacillus licheniformis]|nr:hypothetical protein MUY_004261 [Bacillus licheniformis WX-02]EFV70715.1 hypothetical protein HMPREF1012_03526 [Bacillus sp. BT1B_CT2]EQM25741.1 hypothetical protein N399_22310 [Bacillus licheniformis CG-B52]KUL11248.1 hypothetical protein LI17339_04740 [Bacillus licheniformis LMG 17339]KYC74700.1 hypothetical protein B4092_4381 [Bacillus licheniformis]